MAPKQWCVTTSAQRHRDTGSRRTKNRQRCQRWGRRLPHLTKFIQNLLKITGRITKTKPIGLNISWFVVFILLVFLQLNKTSVSFRCVRRRAFNKAVLPWNLTSFILTCLSSINSFNQRHFCILSSDLFLALTTLSTTTWHFCMPVNWLYITFPRWAIILLLADAVCCHTDRRTKTWGNSCRSVSKTMTYEYLKITPTSQDCLMFYCH